MASVVDRETRTAFANPDWEHYVRARPAYPRSLVDLIYSYRRGGGGGGAGGSGEGHPGWQRLVDIGGGIGVSAMHFAADFDIVHLCDPSPANIEQARRYMPGFIQYHGFRTQMEYSQAVAEQVDRHISPGSADMVICATAAHFIDPDELARNAARILRPGGTFAVFGYWLPFFPDKSQLFNDTFADVLSRATMRTLPPGETLTRSVYATSAARVDCGGGGLDSVPLPEEYFMDPRRVRINWGPEQERHIHIMSKGFADGLIPLASRVEESDRIVELLTGRDPEAEGWRVEMDKAWIDRYMASFRFTKSPRERAVRRSSMFRKWERLFQKECPSGKAVATWQVQVILGTRR